MQWVEGPKVRYLRIKRQDFRSLGVKVRKKVSPKPSNRVTAVCKEPIHQHPPIAVCGGHHGTLHRLPSGSLDTLRLAGHR